MRTRGRFLAALLELVAPGLGMMFLCSFWLGALVLVSTLFITILLCGVAVANAVVVRLADVLNFLGSLLLAHMLWLVTRVLWVWKMTERQPAVAVA
jgi:Na+/melibiose symporter-like transporter